jgi:hypothetical protein
MPTAADQRPSKSKPLGIISGLRELFVSYDECETARHYCRRLATIVLLPAYQATFRNALTCAERDKVLKEPVSWRALASRLERSPRLQAVAASCTSYTPSVWLLEQELVARGKGDQLQRQDDPSAMCTATAQDVYRVARIVDSTGLCFSGGGIRSATFNLGILQGLAKLNLLGAFDYLSTVSGGGYIHQFLAAWLYNRNCLLNDGAEERPAAPAQSATAAASPLPALQEIQNQLNPIPQGAVGARNPMTEQPEPIRWLRRFSNYLTPHKGLFSTDTWVMVSIWLRNTFLNQLTLVSLLGTILLIPHLIHGMSGFGVLHRLYKGSPWHTVAFAGYLWPSVLILVLGVAACWLVISALQIAQQGRIDPRKPPCSGGSHPGEVRDPADRSGPGRWIWLLGLLTCIAAIASPAVYQASFVAGNDMRLNIQHSSHVAMDDQNYKPGADKQLTRVGDFLPDSARRMELSDKALPLSSRISSWFNRFSYPKWSDTRDPAVLVEIMFLLFTFAFCLSAGLESLEINAGFGWVWCVVGSVVGAAGTWAGLYATRLGIFLLCFWKPKEVPLIALVFAPVCVLSAFFLALVLGAGVVGRRTDDSLREAMARLRAMGFLLSFLWIGISGSSLLGPLICHSLIGTSREQLHWKQWASLLTWAGGTLGGVLAGNSDRSSGKGDKSGVVMSIFVKIGPPIFILGLLLLLSSALQTILDAVGGDWTWGLVFTALAFLATTLLFGFRLDINDFSMHAFYRDRLARCYAGASYPHRRANRFTGFAQSDGQIRVADLLPEKFQEGDSAGIYQQSAIASQNPPIKPYPGPLPIFCTTVNLTFGQDLAWQERKGASFAFTPLYSGYSPGWTSDYGVVRGNTRHSYNGFVSTRKFACEGGIAMHTAVAISGAAVSPEMGYHSDPAMAFLLTMFNVRLGWWIKNPRVGSSIQLFNSPSPQFPLWNLFNELLGRATDMSHYVYLTDGGHFDNMGLYELVRRRCRRILICDAEQDCSNVFEGIGSAIRKCRVDFGVEIELDLGDLDPGLVADAVPRRPAAPVHFVLGKIRYPEDDQGGTVVYIKSRVTGDEPGDILNYNRQHPGFPNETTLNQWFTESQFESYRRLGYHSVLCDPQPADTPVPVEVSILPSSSAPGGAATATLSVASSAPAPGEPLRDILQRVFSATISERSDGTHSLAGFSGVMSSLT